MERRGVLAAVLSSALGGTAVVVTRYLTSTLDPLTIGAIRFAGGFLVLVAMARWSGQQWPPRRDWPGTAALGLLFFGLFPILFTAALIYTTAARGALALSTLPLLTMAAAATLGIEPPTLRKLLGVLIAIGGVTFALSANLHNAPPDAWRGDLLMIGAALCMAFYNVWSRPFIARSGPIPFAAFGMGIGAVCLSGGSLLSGGVSRLPLLSAPQWLAGAYLAVICGAVIFYLWAYALGRASPTLVAVSVAINPVTASILAVSMLGEEISPELLIGLGGTLVGIAVASGLFPRIHPTR